MPRGGGADGIGDEGERAENPGRTPGVLLLSQSPDRRAVAAIIEQLGVAVTTTGDPAALDRAGSGVEVVVLDTGGDPDLAWRSLAQLAGSSLGVRVMVLTPPSARADRIQALEGGASDAFSRPLHAGEIAARVRGLLSRPTQRPGGRPASRAHSDSVLDIDFVGQRVMARGRRVDLSPLEFQLLATLVLRHGEVISREDLFAEVWGETDVGIDQVKLYVSYLRHKLELDPSHGPIATVRGRGYRYDPPA